MSTKTLTEAETLSLAQLKVKDRAGLLTDTDERLRYKALQANPPTPDRELSLGGRVVTGHGYRELGAKALKATDRSGLMLDDDVTLAQVGPTGTKTLLRVGVATSAGAFQSIDDQGATYAPTRRPLELLDLVRAGTTTEGSISYVRQGSYTGVAVETAEPSGVTVGTKPEATIPFEVVASPVETIPVWAPATRRALADVDELKNLIDEQLAYDVKRRLEEQLVNGNGTTPNLRGILNTTGVQTQPLGGDSHPLAIVKALALVINAGYRPNAVAIHPDDWVQAITPFITAGGSLGETVTVPVIPTASVPTGTTLVGDFQQAGVWTRSLDVFVSRTHSDFLVKNLAAILCEGRFAVGRVRGCRFRKGNRCVMASLESLESER